MTSDRQPPRRPVQMGCGCSVPFSGMVLLALTAVLAFLIASRTEGASWLWLLMAPLVLGAALLFVRIRITRR